MKFDTVIIRKAIIDSLEKSGDYSKDRVDKIAFHMIDWMDDFIELKDLYENPTGYLSEEVEKKIMKFLIHVPNHLNAAAKLMMGQCVEDVFNLGVIDEGSEVEQ